MLRTRVLTAVVLGPVVLAVAWFREPWLSAGVALVAAVALWEAADLVAAAGWAVPRRGTVVVGTAVAVSLLLSLQGDAIPPGLPLAALALAVIVLAVVALRNAEPRTGLAAWAGSVFAVAWIGLLVPMLAAVGHLGPPGGDAGTAIGQFGWAAGTGWLFVLFGLVWSGDSGAYFVGRAIGRRRLHPLVSPGKTVEGYVGGVVVAVIVTAVLGSVLLDLSVPLAAAIGTLTAAVAPGGDLAKSLLKRSADRKDSGNLFPGHGGMLDRIDSLMFAAPLLVILAVAAAGMQVAP